MIKRKKRLFNKNRLPNNLRKSKKKGFKEENSTINKAKENKIFKKARKNKSPIKEKFIGDKMSNNNELIKQQSKSIKRLEKFKINFSQNKKS